MKISAIIITKNEEEMLPGCLKSLSWVDEIVVVDADSHDKTIAIAEKIGAKVVSVSAGTDYSTSRNEGKKAAKGDWLLYVDADERVSSELRKEIHKLTNKDSQKISYKLPRKNIMLGKWIKHGGFWPDYAHRLFPKNELVKWTGKVHESPTVKGQVRLLKPYLTHYTARSISSALHKSSQWSQIEAKLLRDAGSPHITWWRIIKGFKFKLFELLIYKKGLLDGTRGFILAYIQAFHEASILVNLWHLQNKT